MLVFNMLAFVLCCNWLVARGPPFFFVKCTLIGSCTYIGQLGFLKAVIFGRCVLETF